MPGPLDRRARTIEEMARNIGALNASAPRRDFRPLAPLPGDVYLASWAKSGTTLMQQMFHQLRMVLATGAGDMDFDDINRVVPWEDIALLIDSDMNLPQRAAPRGFKSHRDYARLPSGARYVVTLRDPRETFVSLHRFLDGWQLEPGALSLEAFMPLWFVGGPNGCDYFTHLLSWYARRGEPDTLLTTYRWAAKNRAAMVRRLAAFLGLAVTEAQVDVVAAMTSRDFMLAHADRFDEAMLSAAMEQRIGVPAAADSAKVHAVASDAARLPAAVVQTIDTLWAQRVLPVTGHADFASLAASLEPG